MTVRRLAWSASLGLALFGLAVEAAEPARLSLPASASLNQMLADTVAARLRQSGLLKDYRVDISVTGGTVELSGTVAGQAQREEVVRLVQGIPSVSRVVDRMAVPARAIRPVRQSDLPPALPAPDKGDAKGDAGDKLPPPLPGTGGDKGDKGGIPEPAPIFRAPLPPYAALNPPNMPPYAWPTYAPHNNYSRVAYPTAYPYHAWPYIGPVYPYPKVPLGWRSVKLEWDDGYWWFSRVGHGHDWWKLRFW